MAEDRARDQLPVHYRETGERDRDRPTPGIEATQSADPGDVDVLGRVAAHKEHRRRQAARRSRRGRA